MRHLIAQRIGGRIVAHAARTSSEVVALDAYLEGQELASGVPDVWHDWYVRPDLNEALLCALEREHREEWY